MHDTAYEHGRLFFELYWSESFRQVVDLGSQDVNGSLRDHCPLSAQYIGLDVVTAKGVDVVVGSGKSLPIASNSVDVVVSSSAFEHDACFWDTFLELVRILRPGGLLYVNAPSNYAFHRYPLDCWRFYPDAGVALVRWAARRGQPIDLVESFVALPRQEGWADFVAIFWKAGAAEYLARKGRIADRTQASNIYDLGMRLGGPLQIETPMMTDMEIIAKLTAEAGPRKVNLDMAQKKLAELCEKAQAMALEITKLEGNLAEANAQLVAVRKNVSAIRQSASWRITAPLRWLAALMGWRPLTTSRSKS